ncbi:MAG: type II toxin-antitoxin system RelE/ParE family toxin [candidate division NC10 bacterium]|nr:type II toxin-antitoxin system RelE/ParE family toxin [candidate division NC10 bacterium]
MKPVPFLPAAREEFLAAAHHYGTAASGLGHDFIAAVEQAVARIAAFPEHGSPHLMSTRRVVLRRFPFSVVSLLEPEAVLVVAVAHHSRRPGYWRDRV